MASRSLNVVVAAENRTSRVFNDVARDADKLDRGFKVVGKSTSDLTLRFGALGGSVGTMLPLIAGVGPAMAGASGAASALAVSLGAAAGGAAALGAGFAASMAPIAVVGKQVTSRFEEIKKAQEALTKAQKDGTAESKKQADAAMANLSKSEQAMVGSLNRLAGLQKKVLGGASDGVFAGLSKAIDVLAPKLEGLAAPFTRLGNAMGDGIERVGKLLASGPWQDAFGTFVDSATKLVEPITTVFLSIGNIIRDVAVEAIPYVQQAVQGVADWFGELDDKATRSKISEVVETLVGHTRSWLNLFREVGGLVGNIFGGADVASRGQGLVDMLAGAVSAVSDFVGQLRSGEGAGGEFAARIRDAFETVRTAVSRVSASVSQWVDKNREDINSVIDAFRTVGRFAKEVFLETLVPTVKNAIGAIKPIVTGLASTIRGLVRLVSGLLSGDWDKAWSGAKEAVRGAFRVIKSLVSTAMENMAEYIRDFGPKIVKGIVRGLANMGKALAAGLLDGIKWAASNLPGMAADALKGLGKAIGKQITGAIGNIFGDGIGKSIGDGVGKMAGAFPAFGGGLMGARANMAPVAGAASRFGLGVSSGRRPGSITSSGNQSYHSTGEALDIAGNPAGMLGFFRFMKNTMGPRLAELIYTPGGAGIRNGSPHTYSGAVAADHFDHVHVAIDSGAPGVGDGLGRFNSTAYGPPWNAMNGTGVTATGVDLRPAKQAYGVAVDPKVIPLGSKLRINPNPFGYNGTFTAFDTGGAIKGKRIDFYDWRGRKAQMGWGKASVNVEIVDGSNGGGGGSSAPSKGSNGKGTSGVASGGPSGRVTPAFYAGPEAPSEEQQRVMDYIANRGNPLVPGARPLKGGGPTKGFTPAEVEMGMPEALRDRDRGPTHEDQILANIARAKLTGGNEDDILYASELRDTRKRAMDAALASADPRDDAAAVDAFISARDAVKALTESIDESNRIQAQRDALNETIAANQGKILALAAQGPAIVAAVVAAVSGGIGGQVGLGFQTPGYAGGGANYGAGRL